MKKLTLILILAVIPSLGLIQAGDKKIVVPRGKTYVKVNAKGKEVARYTAGQTMAETADCVQITCPRSFGEDVVCWKCKERLAAPQQSPGD